LKPQGNLLLVELESGQFCIVHNDRLLDDRCWPRDQSGRAVAAYLKMKAELTGDDTANEPSAMQGGPDPSKGKPKRGRS
jgi:hypothetical protein